ncbi:hypothetical protein SADUNF_Sadunf11G0040100 [Salix dunnii]|uniref:Uncharacterized protein n=1 Tax=Salix dunnii TaxID=1413687 RepID=A0A835JJK7_9ROSI|nr:hypothetical protein SADUNF_Sadunf11G0040100 [Salix dunnii]
MFSLSLNGDTRFRSPSSRSMAESEKKTSSSVDPKEKKSLFDVDIGNEFLGNWKSMSVMGDDKMDFGFDTISSGKKKAFNFGNLDMDFDLGGDFGKLSSFKVDMSDLDFTSSSKKAAKRKDTSEAESPMGNRQGKKDSFSFSFEFNELDNFDFGSTLKTDAKTSLKNLDNDGVVSDRSVCQESKHNQARGSDAVIDDGQTEKSLASESVPTSMVETTLGGGGGDSSLNDILPSISESVPTSKLENTLGGGGGNSSLNDILPSISGMEYVVVPQRERTSTEKSISATAEETDQQSCSPNGTVPTEPYAIQTTHVLAVQSLSKNNSTQDIVSNIEREIGSLSTEVDRESGAEQTVNGKIVDGTNPSHESAQPKNSDPLHTGSDSNGGESKRKDGGTLIGNTVEAEPMPDDSDLETTSIRSLSRTAPLENNTSKDTRNSASKLFVTLTSEPMVDKKNIIKEKESGGVYSKVFRRSAELEPQLHHPFTEGVEVSTSGCKGISSMQSILPEIGKRHWLNTIDAHMGRKLVGNSKSPFKELLKGEPSLLGSKRMLKLYFSSDIVACILNRESINCDGGHKGSKPVVTPRTLADKEELRNPAGIGSKMNINDLHNFGCGVNPSGLTCKTTKFNTQSSGNSRILFPSMGLLQNSKIISAERLKAVKKTPDLSSMKISKTMGENKGSNATNERDISFLRNSEKNMEVKGIKASKFLLPLSNAEKNTPLITSVKRKTTEALSTDIVPPKTLKRLSLSPRDNRNFKKCSEIMVEDQVCDQGNRAGSKAPTVLYDHSSGLQIAEEVNMKDVEISLAAENDGNVEKAEAYAKELEAICNMLKKKHEEAKEIMVRAIVNNNSLLMLNHPIFDEKISFFGVTGLIFGQQILLPVAVGPWLTSLQSTSTRKRTCEVKSGKRRAEDGVHPIYKKTTQLLHSNKNFRYIYE